MSDRKKHLDQATENPFPIYSLEGLEWWLSRQPKAESYNYFNCRGACLLGQYLASRQIEWSDNRYVKMCRETDTGRTVAAIRPWTFGAALQRCREAMDK